MQIGRPSHAPRGARAANRQFTTPLVGLGAVALLVGAIGIANIMVISVLERRGGIGLCRALDDGSLLPRELQPRSRAPDGRG